MGEKNDLGGGGDWLVSFFPGERMGRPGFTPGKKLTGGKGWQHQWGAKAHQRHTIYVHFLKAELCICCYYYIRNESHFSEVHRSMNCSWSSLQSEWALSRRKLKLMMQENLSFGFPSRPDTDWIDSYRLELLDIGSRGLELAVWRKQSCR